MALGLLKRSQHRAARLLIFFIEINGSALLLDQDLRRLDIGINEFGLSVNDDPFFKVLKTNCLGDTEDVVQKRNPKFLSFSFFIALPLMNKFLSILALCCTVHGRYFDS